jgi:hypothetical protein
MPLQYNVPTPQKPYTKQYKSFRGVDMSSGITEVDDSRSPYAPNIIADMTGFPEKRPGYKSILASKFSGTINGIHPFVKPDGTKLLIVHAGTKLYSFTVSDNVTSTTEIYSGAANAKSASFVMNQKLYILDGTNYLQYDGAACVAVESVAYIPTTTIGAPPAGGGEKLDSPNMLQPKRINRFQGTASDTIYYLDAENINSVNLVQKLNASGGFDTIASGGYTVDTAAGKITFTVAPGVSPIPGDDNIYVTFSKTISGYADMIKKCTIATFYGIMKDNRIFVSGNPEYRNRDWVSYISDPTYFPDDGYSIVGSENTAIMGYIKQYDSLVVVKEDSDQDATLYLRTATIGNDGASITYPLKQGLVGVGAVSKYAFGVLADDPLFLSKNGVYGLESSAVTYQRTTQLRSYYINTALMKENTLSSAIGAVWNRWYVLFVGGKAYVADSQQANKNKTGSTGYEWYYWLNIPAVSARSFDGDLYFGTSDGDICKFTIYEKYGSMAYYDNGNPIVARWSTKMDDMGDFMRYKTISKRGVGVLAKPYTSTSGKIYFANENIMQQQVKEYSSLNTFDFAKVDFAKFSFTSATNPRVVPVNHKLRNTQTLQLIIENLEGGQGFGILGIQIRYVYTKDVKN